MPIKPPRVYHIQKVEQFLEEQVKTITYEAEQENDEACGICMIDFELFEQVKKLDCHQVHEDGESIDNVRHIFHF